jgi:hypothetical protein
MARKEAEEKARKEAEEMARKEAEEMARKEAEEMARKEAEEMARKEAEEMARKEAEEKARKEAEEKARKAAELSSGDPKKLLSAENVKRDDCLQQMASEGCDSLQREGCDSRQLVLTCMVMGCLNAIDETVTGSAYCAEHEHHPVGQASFEVVRQVLIDIRESTGYTGWTTWKNGWDKLATYTAMEDLGESTSEGVHGVRVEHGKLIEIDLNNCNLTGTLSRPSPPRSPRSPRYLPSFLANIRTYIA